MVPPLLNPARRSLDSDRSQAILDVVLELLSEVGYDQLSMDLVAQRAHASKATIYRRWSNKAEMVAEAVRQMKAECFDDFPDTGSLRSDLAALVAKISNSACSSEGALITGLLHAMRSDEELARLLRENIVEHKRELPLLIVERAIARGDLPAGTDGSVVAEVLPSLIFVRACVTGEPLDESFVTQLIDDVALPLLTGKARTTSAVICNDPRHHSLS